MMDAATPSASLGRRGPGGPRGPGGEDPVRDDEDDEDDEEEGDEGDDTRSCPRAVPPESVPSRPPGLTRGRRRPASGGD